MLRAEYDQKRDTLLLLLFPQCASKFKNGHQKPIRDFLNASNWFSISLFERLKNMSEITSSHLILLSREGWVIFEYSLSQVWVSFGKVQAALLQLNVLCRSPIAHFFHRKQKQSCWYRPLCNCIKQFLVKQVVLFYFLMLWKAAQPRAFSEARTSFSKPFSNSRSD